MIGEAIGQVMRGRDLTEEESYRAMEEMVEGRANPSQIAALLTAWRMKGAAPREILGAAKALRDRIPRISASDALLSMDREEIHVDDETIDRTSFRNGRGTKTFNVSTATALVVAGAGVRVVKSGNVIPSNLVGGEHVLRALGIELDITRTAVERCIEEVGLAFVYSPASQGRWSATYAVRRQLGFRTLLNLVEPLCNPCGARTVFLGAYEPDGMARMASILRALDIHRGMVVHGEDTLDEASITGKSTLCQLRPAGFEVREMVPEDVGLSRATPDKIRGGDAEANALAIRNILNGERGARRDLVLLNAGLALVGCDKADSVPLGMEMAADAIDSGAARGKLESIVRRTNEQGFMRRG
jgi:anthranilate phosphoribosyltransferase